MGPGNYCWTVNEQVWMKLLLTRNGELVLNLFIHACIQASSCVSSTCCSQHSNTTGHNHHLQYVASPVPHPARPPPVAAPPTPPVVQHCHPGYIGSHNAAAYTILQLCPWLKHVPSLSMTSTITITIPLGCACAAQQLATLR